MPRRERSPGSQTPTPTISRSAIPLEANIIELYIDATSVNEQFDEAVFCFTDDTASAIRNGGVPTSSAGAAAVLSAFRKRMRSRRETPVSGTEATLNGAFMDNIDAELLAGLLNRDRPEFFSAYMKGNRFKDLRFHIRPFAVFRSCCPLKKSH